METHKKKKKKKENQLFFYDYQFLKQDNNLCGIKLIIFYFITLR